MPNKSINECSGIDDDEDDNDNNALVRSPR